MRLDPHRRMDTRRLTGYETVAWHVDRHRFIIEVLKAVDSTEIEDEEPRRIPESASRYRPGCLPTGVTALGGSTRPTASV
jgi:hypothetical protein